MKRGFPPQKKKKCTRNDRAANETESREEFSSTPRPPNEREKNVKIRVEGDSEKEAEMLGFGEE